MTLWTTSLALAATLEVVATPLPGQFASVQEAVDAASAGDVIVIGAGTFDGNVHIAVDVTLRGAGMDATLLNPSDVSGRVLTVDRAVVRIEDLTVDGRDVSGGIEAVGPGDVALSRVKLRDGSGSIGAGLLVRSGASVVLHQSIVCDNIATSLGGGMHIYSGGYVASTESLYTGNSCGQNAGGAGHPDGDASFVNNTFVANHGVGGAALASAGSVELVNNLVLHHVALGTYPSGDEAMQVHGDGYFGGPNLYFNNAGGDTEEVLPDDVFGIDPGLPAGFACDSVTLADAALPPGSAAIGAGSANGLFDDFGAVDFDVDGDGFGDPEDCDDDDPARSPGVPEDCNGVDDNCDGYVDEGVQTPWYPDGDGDGFGGPDEMLACSPPYDGWIDVGGDCNDEDVAISPGEREVPCDGVDNDCDPGTADDLGCDTGTIPADTDTDTDVDTDVDTDSDTDADVDVDTSGTDEPPAADGGTEGLSSACGCGTPTRPRALWTWFARR